MKKSIFPFILLFMLFSLPRFGNAQWSTNPAVNNVICGLGGEQAIPKIATCANGDTYIGYFSNETGNYNVRLQRLDALGNILWATGGILISNHTQNSWLTDWDMTCDAANHAILAFNDIRNSGNTNVVAYRISPSGTFVWGADGIMLSNSSAFNASPVVVATPAGNAVVAWSADDVIIMQKLSPTGTLLWGPNGITRSSPNTLSWPQLMPVGTDDVIMKYFDDSGPPNSPTRHVFAQRYNGTGAAVWTSPATISTAGGISAWTQIFPFVNDGNDGFYIAWHDDRDNNMNASVFVQHISSTGATLFMADGNEVSNASYMNHFYPVLALPPGSTDIYCYWNEMNSLQSQWGIFGQKLNSIGVSQWGPTGMTFIPVSTTDVYPYEARNSPTDMVLFYEEYANAIDGIIKAMRISSTGGMVWTPAQKTICSVVSQKVHPVVNQFNINQWILSWEDDRNADVDIYAQNIQLNGDLGPVSSGTISGTITLNGGTGNVTQVVVQAGATTTNPNSSGFYTMNVVTGTYTVTASLTGYYTASQSNVTVLNNQTTTVNLTLNPIPVGYIHGSVTLVGGTGTITDVIVSAGTNTASPDIAGNYTLAVSPGTYNVIATLPLYYPDTVFNITVANNQTVNGVNLTLNLIPTNGLITGTVTLNGGSGNVMQVAVSAGGIATTYPDASGFYTLDLVAGTYDITATLSGYISQMQSGIQVFVNQTTANVNFTLVPMASSGNIQGHVTITGEPADVTLATVSAGTYSIHPDASGNYDLAIPAGTYAVTADHPYTDPQTISNVTVNSGQATPGVDFNLTVNRADMIVKAMEDGAPMNGVTIVINGPEGPYIGIITSDSLIFPHVPYGSYSGMASLGGMYETPADTVINASNHHMIFYVDFTGVEEKPSPAGLKVSPNPANAKSMVTFTLWAGGKYSFDLIDLNGRVVAGTTINLDAGYHYFPLSVVTGNRNISEGSYLLRLSGVKGALGMTKIVFGSK